MALCRKCKIEMMRRVIGESLRDVCRNRKCPLYGVPQGAVVEALKQQTPDEGKAQDGDSEQGS